MFGQVRLLGFVFAGLLVMAPGFASAAGDVLLGGVTPGGDVSINGDSANNDYTITQNTDGTVTVTGNNGTTVNGQNTPQTTGNAVTGKISTNGRGGDDTITVHDVDVEDLKIKDELGTNTIDVDDAKVSDKLEIKNSAGSIGVSDTSWGRRKIRKGTGTVNPASLNGDGSAGSVGTPPGSGGGGKKAARKSKKAPLNAQDQGLPTNNPGQRGVVVPELPNVPSGSYSGKSPKVPAPKGKY